MTTNDTSRKAIQSTGRKSLPPGSARGSAAAGPPETGVILGTGADPRGVPLNVLVAMKQRTPCPASAVQIDLGHGKRDAPRLANLKRGDASTGKFSGGNRRAAGRLLLPTDAMDGFGFRPCPCFPVGCRARSAGTARMRWPTRWNSSRNCRRPLSREMTSSRLTARSCGKRTRSRGGCWNGCGESRGRRGWAKRAWKAVSPVSRWP